MDHLSAVSEDVLARILSYVPSDCYRNLRLNCKRLQHITERRFLFQTQSSWLRVQVESESELAHFNAFVARVPPMRITVDWRQEVNTEEGSDPFPKQARQY